MYEKHPSVVQAQSSLQKILKTGKKSDRKGGMLLILSSLSWSPFLINATIDLQLVSLAFSRDNDAF